MWRTLSAALALLTAAVLYFVNLVYRKRREFDDLPGPLTESRFWGHLVLAGHCKKVFPPNCHMQNWANYIRKKYDLGDFFYVDWWPLGPRWLFIADPELASKYLTTGQSLPKSRLVTAYLDKLLGSNNMVGVDGQNWKSLRSMFNPGFSASHLITLVPYIVDSSMVFLDILREKAKTNELISMDVISTRYAIDIIGKVVMDSDFDSQKRPHPIVTTFRKQVSLMPSASSIGPLDDINLIRPVRLWWNMRTLDALIGAEIDKRIASRSVSQPLRANGSTSEKQRDRKRSIVDLALDANEKEMAASSATGSSKTSSMNSSFRATAIDSVKTFIFAGHDTVSATISYTLYLLHLHDHVYRKVMAELEEVFGGAGQTTTTTTEEVAEKIKAEPHAINKLEYMTAVIKEVLRLFPPASTIRELRRSSDIRAAKDVSFTDPKTGKTYPLTGFDIWPVAHMIHRNEDYFPESVKFIPERFLPSQTPFPDCKLHTPAGKDAWRPFEKGPRNCIGQELAMIESKTVLALILREVDFTAEIDGVPVEAWNPVETRDEFADDQPGSVRHTVEGHKLYQVLFGAARPRSGMQGRLKLRR